MSTGQEPSPKAKIDFSQFLANSAPGSFLDLNIDAYELKNEVATDFSAMVYYARIRIPDIFIFCTSPSCEGFRYFNVDQDDAVIDVYDNECKDLYLYYTCKNCNSSQKTYAVQLSLLVLANKPFSLKARKFGEFPPFGPPIPARIYKLIKDDRELFLVGRRAENQGMGIGSFAYYRRVVENQKNRIFDEIIKAVNKLNKDHEIIYDLERAKEEIQFTKSVEKIKHGLPEILMIEGENPLLLLHNALSRGVHSLSDEECLSFAKSIRAILIELSDRLDMVLKEKSALEAAIKCLKEVRK